MKKSIVSPEYQSTTRMHEVKGQIYAHHFPDFSLGAVCSLTSAQQSVSRGQMDKQEGMSLKLTARRQEWLIMFFRFKPAWMTAGSPAWHGRQCYWDRVPSERTEKQGTAREESANILWTKKCCREYAEWEINGEGRQSNKWPKERRRRHKLIIIVLVVIKYSLKCRALL